MNSGRSLYGRIQVEITCAEPEKTLFTLNQRGIRIYGVSREGPLTVRFHCARNDCRQIERFCSRSGAAVRFTPAYGTCIWKRTLFARPVLTAGVSLLLILTFFLPTRVLFFEVEGNARIPSRHILETMEACGIRFGVSRRTIRSEKMKNVLLEAMPELKWAGINTSGCTAVISVRERETQHTRSEPAGITGIIAATDGYITSSVVVKGTGLCEPGQIVREGQLLISGYADQGICIQATGAEGEIYAQTVREQEAVSPSWRLQRKQERSRSRYVSLILGKKRINLWKGSRIWDTTCGRMYEEYYMTLPGGFRLPAALGIETVTQWHTEASQWSEDEMEQALMEHTRDLVMHQTIAGTISQQTHSFRRGDGIYGIRSRFLCSEMIGRVITEEIGETNGKTD